VQLSPKVIRISILTVSAIFICTAVAFDLHGLGQRMDLLPFLAVCAATGAAGIVSGWFVDPTWLNPSMAPRLRALRNSLGQHIKSEFYIPPL
jgi:hypothetical protein